MSDIEYRVFAVRDLLDAWIEHRGATDCGLFVECTTGDDADHVALFFWMGTPDPDLSIRLWCSGCDIDELSDILCREIIQNAISGPAALLDDDDEDDEDSVMDEEEE